MQAKTNKSLLTTRRSFLGLTSKALLGIGLGGLPQRFVFSKPTEQNELVDRINSAPKLFCTAYITPDAPGQGNQEAIVARYPLVLVPQDMRRVFVQWRNRVRQLNPSIMMLGYQIVIEETNVPGPGHDELRKVSNAWCEYPGGFVPQVKVGGTKMRRIFDPRSNEWQQRFIDACKLTLQSYPYDGLFLDQCTVFNIAHPSPEVRNEMRYALQATLLKLRKAFPDKLLVGNSSYSWNGLNGELNEGRLKSLVKETRSYEGHAMPQLEMYQSRLSNAQDIDIVKKEMALAHSYGAFYGAAVNYQQALWFKAFDKVVAKARVYKVGPNIPTGLRLNTK